MVRLLLLLALVGLAGCPPKRASEPVKTAEKTKKKKKKAKKAKKKKPKEVAKADPAPEPGTDPEVVEVLKGHAVWYGGKWHGRKTASGERFDKRKMTAAHRSLKMGTRVRVTNERNGKSVIVRINDRGPYGKDRRRVIDVSEAAAEKLDFVDAGWCPVTIEVLREPEETE
jgi:rare lipoprotein A